MGEWGPQHTEEAIPVHEVVRHIIAMGGKPVPNSETTIPGKGPAIYFRLPGARALVGLIGRYGEGFCETCNRLRLTADGKLRSCLVSGPAFDVRTLMRNGASDEELLMVFRKAIVAKPERGTTLSARDEISYNALSQIGG
ncbi:MAG: hypothetical protein HPY52_16265 [Firmicutes bacterium]|nr:hypothetical protein [Bacillota bacterium]